MKWRKPLTGPLIPLFYKENGSYVAPVVATAEVEVTIGNVTGDVTANLSIET